MTAKTKAARHCCNNNRANVHEDNHNRIITDYERGALIAGLITAVSFGSMFIHAAVVL